MAPDNKKLVIDPSWCKACGICIAFCPKDVLEIKNNVINIKNIKNCIKCGLCELRCPDYAIYLEDILCKGDKINA
ncbi:4Fe-4S dicluster domain-containing protein [Tepidibacter formicigenes]|jgi:2-oxoglutarate ferredoxin oxidoreductase subunit delta|uniref:2-oxoglutarate ferredoxin oxidoreductase subunit delta n=1 Tax=Tepidibacter formicigenes DSM 15518 TaxID=1123349 RepID=A0A1M6M9I8_9FIRM|nr:4Fe-4S binding protein [Tepidibacter formicigenes]SHJ80122.1 2-oxoglutarate ferredoxin oxidoreductase subunit delta [Tepidibacter formicigenes DSM 15518]